MSITVGSVGAIASGPSVALLSLGFVITLLVIGAVSDGSRAQFFVVAASVLKVANFDKVSLMRGSQPIMIDLNTAFVISFNTFERDGPDSARSDDLKQKFIIPRKSVSNAPAVGLKDFKADDCDATVNAV